MMRLIVTFRNRLLLAILFILAVSYAILLISSVTTLNRSTAATINKDLEASLRFAKGEYLGRPELVRNALTLPLSAQPVHARLVAGDRYWLQDAINRWHKTLNFLDILTIVDRRQRVVANLLNGNGQQFLPGDMVAHVLAQRKPLITTELVSVDTFCRESQSALCLEKPAGKELLVQFVILPVISTKGDVLGAVVAGDLLNSDAHLPYQQQKVFGKDVELVITQLDEKIASSRSPLDKEPERLASRVVKLLENGFPFLGKARFGGRDCMMVAEPINNSHGQFIGSMAVALDQAQYVAIQKEGLRNILIAAAASIPLVFFLVYLVTRQFTTSLQRLTESVGRIEGGDYSQRAAETGIAEIITLHGAFNRMAMALAERDGLIRRKNEDLEEMNEQLEKRVVERTAQLKMEMGMQGAILNSIVDGVVVTDRKNRVVLINHAAKEILGADPDETIGQPIQSLCQLDEWRGLEESLITMSLSSDQEKVREFSLERGGRKLLLSITRLDDEGHHFSGFVLILRDITQANEVNRAKNEFIATVSHELKTPLTAMKGSLQYILHKGRWLTGTEREMLSICLRNTERLIRMVTSILDISRIEAGKAGFIMRPIVVSDLLLYAMEEIKSAALACNISLVNSVSFDLPQVCGDYDRLVQVLYNLLANAVKFSPADTVVIISAEKRAGFVAISVADHGTVIKPADRDKLFGKFQQLGGTESSDAGGSGLGLAICKEIVEKHGGTINYSVGTAGGNVFTFTVPIYGGSHE